MGVQNKCSVRVLNMNTVDTQYLTLVQKVLDWGIPTAGRNGTTLSLFGETARFPIRADALPILTTKKMNFESIVHELLWFISGRPDIREFKQKTKIWDAWADQNDNLEFSYGRYWRHYPVVDSTPFHLVSGAANQSDWGEVMQPKGSVFCHYFDPIKNKTIPTSMPGSHLCFDQLAWLVCSLKVNPHSRRLVLNAWYPPNATAAKLPPCHLMSIWNVQEGRLNCHLIQRSGDLGAGIPYNWTSYSLLTLLLAREASLEPGELFHTITDLHLYENQIAAVSTQLGREPFELPSITIGKGSVFSVRAEDFSLENYQHHPKIKVAVSP